MGRVGLATWAGVVALGLVLTACNSASSGADDGTTSVVASFYPLEEAVSQVGGDLVTVENLTPPGVEPHDLELSPDAVESIATAEVVLYLGGGFQPAIEEALQDAEGRVVDGLSAVTTVPAEGEEAEEGLTVDPHIWLDPTRFARRRSDPAEALEDAGVPAPRSPPRAEELRVELEELDQAFRSGLSDCDRDLLVTNHDAFGYLASAYGLRQEAIAGLEPDVEPSAKRLADLKGLVEREGVTTILTEELVSPDVAETLAGEAGTRGPVYDRRSRRRGGRRRRGLPFPDAEEPGDAPCRARLSVIAAVTDPLVEAEGVSYAYGSAPVVVDVDLSVRKGEFVALVGPNGSGKSTLLRVLLGALRPGGGSVRLLGQPASEVGSLADRLRAATADARSRRPGDRPRDRHDRTARPPWLVAPPPQERSRPPDHAIDSVDLADQAVRPITELSGGQQQRAFIARAFASEPELLVLDEPFAGIDAESQRRFRDSLVHLIGEHGAGVLLVSQSCLPSRTWSIA